MMLGRGDLKGQLEHRRIFGVHLMPMVEAVRTQRPSVVVELDGATVQAIAHVQTIEDVVEALGDGPLIVAVDTPLRIANPTGRRALDELLAWLDVPVFPISRARVDQVWGGSRGQKLAAALASKPDAVVLEAVPDLVLRVLAWQASGREPCDDLQAFRTGWLDLRPAPYRPKGLGRARPAAMDSAVALIRSALDIGRWRLSQEPDDWQAIADAAVVDALLCAYSALSVARGHGVVVASDDGSPCALPTVAMLHRRIEVNVERLRRDGHGLRLITASDQVA